MKNPIFLIFLMLIVGGIAVSMPESGRGTLLWLIILLVALFALAVLVKDPRKKKDYFRALFYGDEKEPVDKTNKHKNIYFDSDAKKEVQQAETKTSAKDNVVDFRSKNKK